MKENEQEQQCKVLFSVKEANGLCLSVVTWVMYILTIWLQDSSEKFLSRSKRVHEYYNSGDITLLYSIHSVSCKKETSYLSMLFTCHSADNAKQPCTQCINVCSKQHVSYDDKKYTDPTATMLLSLTLIHVSRSPDIIMTVIYNFDTSARYTICAFINTMHHRCVHGSPSDCVCKRIWLRGGLSSFTSPLIMTDRLQNKHTWKCVCGTKSSVSDWQCITLPTKS